MNERLVKGRKEIFFSNEFAVSAAKKLPNYAVKYYVDTVMSDEHVLRGSFGFYRALNTTIAQNEQRKSRRLSMPVLAIDAEYSTGEGVGNTMKLAADDGQSVVLPGSGHWVAEEAPEELMRALREFLAPYRDGEAAAAHETHERSVHT